MPRIAGVATAVPEHVLEQAEAKQRVLKMFGPAAERLLPVFDNAQIDSRHFVRDIEWFEASHDFTETNDLYIEETLKLSERVVVGLAERCGIATTDFDAIFFVSTTGLSTPSIDARLFNRIALSPHIKRIPIWGLGCAAGVGGIARAFDYVKAYPKERTLVLSVELCSLAFQRSDQSKSNLIATALFGDGAAACLVVGDDVDMPGPRVLRSLSTIYPDTLDVMGWRITSNGFGIVLSRDIPSIVDSLVAKNVCELLEAANIPLTSIKHFIAHPGGMKVMEAYQKSLELPVDALKNSLDVLREYGNMSSATVLFILERFLSSVLPGSGEYGIISALGPGFSSELVLVQW
jgi:alkylresorcinol/alkylpyrone synthase